MFAKFYVGINSLVFLFAGTIKVNARIVRVGR